MTTTTAPTTAEAPVGAVAPRPALTAAEFADAGVFAALAALLVAVGKVVPHLGALEAGAVVPFLLIGARHRVRVAVAAAVAAGAAAALIAGAGAGVTVAGVATVGGLVGLLLARGRGPVAAAAVGALLGALAGGAADLLLLLLPATRALLLGSAEAGARGALTVVGTVPALTADARLLTALVTTLIGLWAVLIPLGAVVAATAGFTAVALAGRPLLRRLQLPGVDPLTTRPAETAAPGPLPVRLTGVAVRYPEAEQEALRVEDLRLEPGRFVVVTGANGSGKSTLLRCLAGAPVTEGRVERPGAVGLGRAGGTALVLQRPETQVLGATVAEDLRWALPGADDDGVEQALAEVGLAGLGDRPTAVLSGGQLQRLALAGALARQPALLLSDESTAMVDAEGRAGLVALLARAARTRGTAVVHVTHFEEEAASADRHLTMAAGRIAADRTPPSVAPAAGVDVAAAAPPPGEPVLRLTDVGFVHAPGTPWEHPVLAGVDLELRRGEGVRIVGANGSGKTTLARLIAGLARPTSGTCSVGVRPAHRVVGSVAIAFQHPRLQVQRATAGADVAAAAGLPVDGAGTSAAVAAALAAVGLDPALAARRVDALSGGQLRRVALAGVLASRPEVLVLDEPFAGLDPASRDALIDTLVQVRDKTGLALVLITHDPTGSDRLCHRSLHLDGGALR